MKQSLAISTVLVACLFVTATAFAADAKKTAIPVSRSGGSAAQPHTIEKQIDEKKASDADYKASINLEKTTQATEESGKKHSAKKVAISRSGGSPMTVTHGK